MLARKFLPIYILSVSLIFAGEAFAFWVWTPQTRKWVNPKYAAKDSPEEQLEFGRGFFEAKDYDRAIAEFKKLIRFYSNSRLAAEAQYYIGRAYEEKEEHAVAFKEFQKVIDNYPHSERVNEIVERQYHLGELFLEGEKVKVMGAGLLPGLDTAIEIFGKVIDNAPYGPYADMAQYKLALCYNKAGRFDEARDAFQKLIENYPNSKLQPDAKYQLAVASTKISLKADYDQQQTEEAVRGFERFRKEHPESELASASEQELSRLRERQAEQTFKTAEFYYKQGKPRSAAIYYEEIVTKFADTKYAGKAAEKLTLIKKVYE